ncbi:MAG: guanylate kinase [Gammaproteobacteria bacterium]
MTEQRGNLFIVSAPSGAGKTTLVKALLETMPDLAVSISHTTRPPRPSERDGQDYHFVDEAAFLSLVEEDRFLEHARVFDHYYGTSRDWVQERLVAGVDVILEIDWQGARQVRERLPDAVGIFILPPSYATLKARLKGRGDEEATVRRRMDDAARELSHYAEYEFLVINDDLETARQDLAAVFRAAGRDYRRHRAYYDDFVDRILPGKPDPE